MLLELGARRRPAEALKVYEHYQGLLQTQLGIEPTPAIQDLIRALQ